MRFWLIVLFLLAVGYVLGRKFPGIGQRVGLA